MSLLNHFTIYLNEFQHFFKAKRVEILFASQTKFGDWSALCVFVYRLNPWRFTKYSNTTHAQKFDLVEPIPHALPTHTTYRTANCGPIHSYITYIHRRIPKRKSGQHEDFTGESLF